MKNKTFIILIIIGTLLSLFIASSPLFLLFFPSPAFFAQIILLVIAIILIISLVKNRILKVLMWIFLIAHILIAGFQTSFYPLSIIELAYYLFLLIAYVKLLKKK